MLLRIRDELRHRGRGQGGVRHQHEATAREFGDRPQRLVHLPAQLDDVRDLADQRVHAHQQRVAVRGGLQQLADGDGTRGARLGIDDHRAAEFARERLGHDPRDQVRAATGGAGDEQAQGFLLRQRPREAVLATSCLR